MAREDPQKSLDVTRLSRSQRSLEDVRAGEADAPLECLDQVVPVEQLDRRREARSLIQRMAAAPSDTKKMRSAPYTPRRAQVATRRSAKVVQLAVSATYVRSTRPRVYASLALAIAVAPAAIAWSGLAPLLRTGASIQLVAERPA